jgi:glycosyltransferase involved in cell wall biosynthesis
MSRRDDVTVVIPCFNHGRFLGEAVSSALSQTAGEPRIVVVDDGSTDPDTLRALEELPDEVEVLRQGNAGPAAARNAGIRATDSPYLLMLDADDRLPPDALEVLLEALEADPRAGYAYGTMRHFGDWSGEVDFPDFDPYRLLYRGIVGWIGLLRRRTWEEVGGYDTELGGMEDWNLTLAALEHGWHGRKVDHVVLDYRKHDWSGVERDRARHRELFKRMRARHPDLYAREAEFARESDLGRGGRAFYRTWWRYRPLPARLERWLYGRLLFRGRAGGDESQ